MGIVILPEIYCHVVGELTGVHWLMTKESLSSFISPLPQWSGVRIWHELHYWYFLLRIQGLAKYDCFLCHLQRLIFYSWCFRGEVSNLAWDIFFPICTGSWFVACSVTAKRLGIGSQEHVWNNIKHVKDGKRSIFIGNYLEKRAILFKTARLEDACLLCTGETGNGDIGDDDILWESTLSILQLTIILDLILSWIHLELKLKFSRIMSFEENSLDRWRIGKSCQGKLLTN